jgi:hypothetical protein
VSIMVVWGGYPLPRRETVQSFLYDGYFSWRGRRPCIMTPSCAFPAKSPFLNYMGWRIEPSCYWAYTIYFWALVQFKYVFGPSKYIQFHPVQISFFSPYKKVSNFINVSNYIFQLTINLVIKFVRYSQFNP